MIVVRNPPKIQPNILAKNDSKSLVWLVSEIVEVRSIGLAQATFFRPGSGSGGVYFWLKKQFLKFWQLKIGWAIQSFFS